MKLVSAYARGVMINSLIDDARELAIARTMHRAAQYVLHLVDPGDYLAEPDNVRKDRYDEARAAASAAAVVLLARPNAEEVMMSEQQAEKLRTVVAAALATVDAVERTLIVEYIMQERPFADVAREVGVDYHKARYRMMKALLKVGDRMKRALAVG